VRERDEGTTAGEEERVGCIDSREKLGKLPRTSFSLREGIGLHGGRKPSRNWGDLLGFSGLEPRSCGRSPKEVTLNNVTYADDVICDVMRLVY
jgi:hypothetical protein